MSELCVRVAVRVRPLLPREVLHNHQVCVRTVPDTGTGTGSEFGSGHVMLGSDRLYSFDHAFGPTANQDEVYESCVQPLVRSLLDGHNATVFCYGQTGSGKTYTLGGGGGGSRDDEGGIIDRVAQDVFQFLGEKTKSCDDVEATVRVSYMELYMEELRDLLELHTVKKELHIREDEKGNTVVVGAKEITVSSTEELLSIVEMGNALRHTGSTGMNEHSSRSHAILTLQLIRCCHNNSSKSLSSSKLCLVDLAGSERAGKTGNTGTRLKESVQINTGLLALGNVIRTLTDPARTHRGNTCNSAHIPYRAAKITRLLRDSLGGTAHTLMVACVSPSHHSVAETLSVLQFASKVRHIRNCPRAIPTHEEFKSCPTAWNPAEARLGELEYEVKTLRELLKEKEREMEMQRQRTSGKAGEGESFKQSSLMRISESSEPDQRLNQSSQYCLLAQEAAALLTDISGFSPDQNFRQQLHDWQKKLTSLNNTHQIDKDCSEEGGDQPDHLTLLQLREELNKCQKALNSMENLLEEKDAELRQVQKDVEKLLEERKTQLQALEEEKEHNRIQTEQLVDQQIQIDHLRSGLMSFRSASPGEALGAVTSGSSGKRPHSVPLIRNSCGHWLPRKIHSSPPAYSLERVMAAFKMRGHLLLAKLEEKDEVYCPFKKQWPDSKDGRQEQEEDDATSKMTFRHSLNQTWTSHQKKSPLKENKTGLDQTSNGNPLVQKSQQASGSKEKDAKQSHMRNARVSATQRRIHDLTVNIFMEEELIKELNKSYKDIQAVERHGRHNADGKEDGILARLSMQNQQVRADVYRSIQQLRLQRAKLQTNLRQQRRQTTDDDDKECGQSREQRTGDLAVCKSNDHEESEKKLCDSSWLEEEEDHVLQRRAELQELEDELKRREEVVLHREVCQQQKNNLEVRMLHSSQALSQDLLRVSAQLGSVEEQLKSSSNVRQTGGVTIEELEKERDMLKKRWDTLDVQLKENRVLSVEEWQSLLQLEEAIEALDAALEFKNQFIQDKQRKLEITNSCSYSSQRTDPAQLCDVIRKLRKLSPPEALELLIKYFNKVVCLREVERNLQLHCEELELHAGEQEQALREMEAAMKRLTVDSDRRLTQQHRDHQNNIQLLLQKLHGESQQAIQDKLQHLERELFFYKSTSRQLKKKLKDLTSGNHPSHKQEHRQTHNMEIQANTSKSQIHDDEVPTSTRIATSYTKIYAAHTDQKTELNSHMRKHADQTPYHCSLPVLQSDRKTKPEYTQINTQAQSQGGIKKAAGGSGEFLEMTPVRLCRKELRQICPADLQVSGPGTGRLGAQQSVVETSTESIMEDSIEVPRNTDR